MSRARLVVGVMLLVVGAGCGSDEPTPQSASPSQPGPTTFGIPPCVEPVDRPINCVVQSPGPVPSFTARYELDPGSEQPVKLTLTAVDASQVIEEEVGATPSVPQFRDLNGDGLPELLVPRFLATANTAWAIWASDGSAPRLVRAGEVGASDFAVSQSGEVIAVGRDGATSWIATFYALDRGTLTAIASAIMQLESRQCSVTMHQPLELTQAGLDARFCGDPAVRSM